jgi:hypothetical protein
MHQRDRGNRHTWSVAGSHHLRFKFVCVSAPFAPTQGGILVNSVHLSTYSLSGHDAPKAAASIQDAITGCLPTIAYGKHYREHKPISTAMAESPVNQVRCAVINGDLEAKLAAYRACIDEVPEDVSRILEFLQRTAEAEPHAF